MLENRPATAAKPVSVRQTMAECPAASRAKGTNKPLYRANGNSSQGRRIRDLFHAFMKAMGSPTENPLLVANALAAAELRTAAEEARAKFLAGDGAAEDLEQIIRLENLAGRAEKKLGIKPRAPTPTMPLRDRMGRSA
jgi:hypothetical protein